jgi:hypothetical protein
MSKGKKETILVVWGEEASRAAEDIHNCGGGIKEMVDALKDRGLEPNNVRPSTYEFKTRGEVNAFTQGVGDAGDEDGAQAYTIYGKKEIKRYNDRLAKIEKAWKDDLVSRSDQRRYAKDEEETELRAAAAARKEVE